MPTAFEYMQANHARAEKLHKESENVLGKKDGSGAHYDSVQQAQMIAAAKRI
jgi:hypothetical protein